MMMGMGHITADPVDADIVRLANPFGLLSDVERQVVLLSLRDKRRTIGRPSRYHRLWRCLFGARRSNRLADPQLEALRAFCVHYRLYRTAHRRDVLGRELGFETMLAAAALLEDHLSADDQRD